MPPRYAYWTIIAGGLPTAFRSADRDELLPTFTRIRHKHPDAEMKWFARGKLWDSPDSARRDAEERRNAKRSLDAGARRARGRDWRPGGDHRDPRQNYKDAKHARNARERKRKFDRRQRFAEAGEPRERERPVRPRPPQSKRGPERQDTRWHPGQRTSHGPRQFQKKSFSRNQQRDEPSVPPRPEPPEREPRPREGTEPTPPPRPAEPAIPAPGPPERGRVSKRDGRRR